MNRVINRKTVAALLSMVLLAFHPGLASAEAAQPVQLTGAVKVDKVVVVNGAQQHQLSDPKVVVPGDHLIFSTGYRNTGAAPVKNFVVTNPVPPAVAYTPDAADTFVVSVDGGKTWGPLAQLKVADGQGGLRPAQGTDVTHVRWTLPALAPGASGELTYKAIVR